MKVRSETELKIEAIEKRADYSKDDFSCWLQKQPIEDRIIIEKHLGIGIYDNSIGLFSKLKYIPNSITVHGTVVNTHFVFVFEFSDVELEEYVGKVILKYKVELEEYVGVELGGRTSVWCNPYDEYKISDNLICKVCERNDDSVIKGLIEIYEFLIDKKII